MGANSSISNPMNPQSGDLVICSRGNTAFDVIDARSLQRVAGPFPRFEIAYAAARERSQGAIWQQSFDNRGRALGDPVKLLYSGSDYRAETTSKPLHET